jgi:hypothetical protein
MNGVDLICEDYAGDDIDGWLREVGEHMIPAVEDWWRRNGYFDS